MNVKKTSNVKLLYDCFVALLLAMAVIKCGMNSVYFSHIQQTPLPH